MVQLLLLPLLLLLLLLVLMQQLLPRVESASFGASTNQAPMLRC